MNKILCFIIILCITISFVPQSFAYGSVRVQKDYRFTTQQDRNQRIQAYKEYLETNEIFNQSHYELKEKFKPYKDDENSKNHIRYIKKGKPIPEEGIQLKGNYYEMADKILANYSVIYDEDPKTEYIYDLFGNLYQVKVLVGEEYIYPHYQMIYSFNGYLQQVHFFGLDSYEYIFLANGNFQGVVINEHLYNRVGRPVKIWHK